MSSYTQPKIKTFIAEGSLVGKEFHFVKLGTNGEKVMIAAAGEKAIGVLMTKDVADKQACEVALLGGGALLKVSGNVSTGDSVKSDINGQGVVGVAGDFCPAIIMENGVIGDIVPVILDAHRA